MLHSEGRFTGADGADLYRQQWLPDGDPRATLVVVHGVGEHSGRYMNLVAPLVEDGIAVFAYDQRGHGASPGARVYVDSWSQYHVDLGTYLTWAAEQVPGRPLFVYGHSMGSLVVLEYLLSGTEGLSGAIISGVALEPAGVGKPWQVFMAKTLSHVTPRLSVSLGIDAAALSRDPAVVAAYRDDPLVSGGATVRWGAESLEAVTRIKAGMGGIDLPVLVVHGEADQLNLLAGARALYDALPNAHKTIRVYPGCYHEPHNDLCAAEVAHDVSAWLTRMTREEEEATP